MLLTAVIFILICGVAYTVSTRTAPTGGAAGDNVTPPHEILRPARVSANDRIAWETNVGGSGDEYPVAVHVKNNEIYIFGNTDSSDRDFAMSEKGKTRGFGARLSLAGRTLAFTVFDFTIAKAVPTQSGWAVAGNEGSVAGIYLLTDSLAVSGKASMSPIHKLNACGLYIYDNRYFLAAESYDEVTKKTSLLINIYTVGLSLEREKLFSHTYSLRLLDIMPYENGYILAAAASYQDLGYLTVARFNMLSEPAYSDFNLGYTYAPTAFLPLGNGYAAIADKDGGCELLTLNQKLVKTDVKFLTETPNANEKTMFYAGATYAYTGEKLLQLGDDGRAVGSVDYAPKKILDFCSNDAAAFIAGANGNSLTFAMIGKQKSETFSLSAITPSRAALSATANGLLFLCDNAGTTQDCGGHFGGADVWAGRLNI